MKRFRPDLKRTRTPLALRLRALYKTMSVKGFSPAEKRRASTQFNEILQELANMKPVILLLLLIGSVSAQEPAIELRGGDSLRLKPLANANQTYLPVWLTCVSVNGVVVTPIKPGTCGINVFTTGAGGSTIGNFPLTFYVPQMVSAWQSPTVAQSTGWQNFTIANLQASDNLRSIAVDVNYRTGTVGSFGLSVPATAVITGIEVEAEISSSVSGALAELQVSLSTDGTTFTTTRTLSQTGTNDVPRVYGGAADLWGRTWTSGDIANLQVRLEGRSSAGGCRLDMIRVRVYYF